MHTYFSSIGLCPGCSELLNYRSKKREVKRLKKSQKKSKKEAKKPEIEESEDEEEELICPGTPEEPEEPSTSEVGDAEPDEAALWRRGMYRRAFSITRKAKQKLSNEKVATDRLQLKIDLKNLITFPGVKRMNAVPCACSILNYFYL